MRDKKTDISCIQGCKYCYKYCCVLVLHLVLQHSWNWSSCCPHKQAQDGVLQKVLQYCRITYLEKVLQSVWHHFFYQVLCSTNRFIRSLRKKFFFASRPITAIAIAMHCATVGSSTELRELRQIIRCLGSVGPIANSRGSVLMDVVAWDALHPYV